MTAEPTGIWLKRGHDMQLSNSGMSLLELLIASLIMGVGSLAVFTLYLHLQLGLPTLEMRYQAFQEQQTDYLEPFINTRWQPLSCEFQGP